MKNRPITLLIPAMLLMAFASAASADEVTNPEFKMWSEFKAGSTVTRSMTTDSAGRKIKVTQKATLKSIDRTKAVVSMQQTLVFNGQEIKQPSKDREILAKIKKAEAEKSPANPENAIERGEESIEVAGKKLKCKWYTTKAEQNGTSSLAKVWLHESIPGHIAKMEATTKAGGQEAKVDLVVTAFEKK